MRELSFNHWSSGAGRGESQNLLDCVRMTQDDGFKWSDTDCVFTKASPICERNIKRGEDEEEKKGKEEEKEELKEEKEELQEEKNKEKREEEELKEEKSKEKKK